MREARRQGHQNYVPCTRQYTRRTTVREPRLRLLPAGCHLPSPEGLGKSPRRRRTCGSLCAVSSFVSSGGIFERKQKAAVALDTQTTRKKGNHRAEKIGRARAIENEKVGKDTQVRQEKVRHPAKRETRGIIHTLGTVQCRAASACARKSPPRGAP